MEFHLETLQKIYWLSVVRKVSYVSIIINNKATTSFLPSAKQRKQPTSGHPNDDQKHCNSMIAPRFFFSLIAACLVIHPALSFVAPPSRNNAAVVVVRSATVAVSAASEMPDALADWGCDAELWKMIPFGSNRDLERYARTGKEELGRNRIATLREISTFLDDDNRKPGAVVEPETWFTAQKAWEASETAKKEAEKARLKAEKKAAREAANAAKS